MLGSLVLMLPVCVAQNFSYIDALFVATSAVCVTGLTTIDISIYFTRFGQTVIIILAQFGGLGTITYTILILRLLKKRISISTNETFLASFEDSPIENLVKILPPVVFSILALEMLGAALLSFHFSETMPLGDAIFHGLFHSISAFCNAGFSTFSTGLIPYAEDIPVLTIISLLIVIGGLGIVVLVDVGNKFRKKSHRITAHTRLVLYTTVVLLVLGTLAIFFLEKDRMLSDFSLKKSFMISLFHSVSARTAGFNTIDFTFLNAGTLFFIMILMFIGGAPGSSAGGVKVSTFSILFLAALSRVRYKEIVTFHFRTISYTTVFKAVSVFMMGIAIVVVGYFLLLVLGGSSDPVAVLFETVSATGTVGLTTGITPKFNSIGKLILIVLMFLGRVGPITMAMTFPSNKQGYFKYANAEIMTG